MIFLYAFCIPRINLLFFENWINLLLEVLGYQNNGEKIILYFFNICCDVSYQLAIFLLKTILVCMP